MLQQETAELLALQVLGWLATNDDLFPTFLAATGASAADLAAGASSPEFLASVLDFLLQDDAWIIDFCDSVGKSYTEPMQARAWLPGGQAMNWT